MWYTRGRGGALKEEEAASVLAQTEASKSQTCSNGNHIRSIWAPEACGCDVNGLTHVEEIVVHILKWNSKEHLHVSSERNNRSDCLC